MATKKEALINEQNLVHEVFTHPSGVQIKVIRNKAEGKQFIRGAGLPHAIKKINEAGYPITLDELKQWANGLEFKKEIKGLKLNEIIPAGYYPVEWGGKQYSIDENWVDLPDGCEIDYEGFLSGSGEAVIEVVDGVSYWIHINAEIFGNLCTFNLNETGMMTYKGLV